MSRTVKRLSKEAEARLTDALGSVADLVAGGESPTDAIVKVASGLGLPAGHATLMVTTYNIGRSEAQRKGGNDLFEKSAEFELADAAAVLERMFPERVKTAAEVAYGSVVSADYSRRPDFGRPRNEPLEKVASAGLPPMETRSGVLVVASPQSLPPEPAFAMKRAYEKSETLRRRVEAARGEASHAGDELSRGIAKLADYFREFRCQPFPVVRDNACRLLGKKASVLMDMVAARVNGAERQKLARTQMVEPVRFDTAPYSLIEGCLKLGESYLSKQAAYESLEKSAATESEELLRPFSASPTPAAGSGEAAGVLGFCEKEANGLVSGLAGYALGKARSAPILSTLASEELSGPSMDDMRTKATSSLTDPVLQAKIRNAQTGAMLSDLMANDEVIRGYHPDEVLQHFNSISQIAPRAASNQAMVQAMLRKRLVGGVNAIDPYDIDLMLNVENKIKQRDDPSYGSVKTSEEKGVFRGNGSVLD